MVTNAILDTVIEGVVADGRNTVWDGDRFQTITATEGIISNARHTVWDGNRGQVRTRTERTNSNTRHFSRSVHISYLFRNNNIASITIIIIKRT